MNQESTTAGSASETVLDCLVRSVRTRGEALNGQARPAAVLWTDPGAEWRPLAKALRTDIPELLTLGDHDPETRSGPAIWLRCGIDGALPNLDLPNGRPPIIWLPGVARERLRAGEECPDALKPLVELLYRGVHWHQVNGRDWTPAAFLTGQAGLDIAGDDPTQEALLRALPELAGEPLAKLRGKRLRADDFNHMLSEDPIRDLLRWMGDPDGLRSRMEDNRWQAFCERCRDELEFDPEIGVETEAGQHLGSGQGQWAKVWERFAEAPRSFPGIVEVLRRSEPVDELFLSGERWPKRNDAEESRLRQSLKEVAGMPHADACKRMLELEAEHGPRRQWLWAALEQAPLAQILEPLAKLAGHVGQSLGGTTPDDVAAAWLDRGWQGDAAAWEATATTDDAGTDGKLIAAVVRHLYEPWLDESARAFQNAVERHPLPDHDRANPIEAEDGECILFVDGLRYDLGRRLAESLEARGFRAQVAHRWAALPSVTATAKPAVTPAANEIEGGRLGQSFAPVFRGGGREASAQRLRSKLREMNYQTLDEGEFDVPFSETAKGWAETGRIDHRGHQLQAELAHHVAAELKRLAELIAGLCTKGWHSVRVVTDHGWLLLPGGLPKVDLPKHLTESRWARCAVIAGDSAPDVQRVPWHWNARASFASPPGIACFNKSDAYAHGGLSIQECLTPDIRVSPGAATAMAAVSVVGVSWRGLRCFVEVDAQGAQVFADLRLERPKGESVAADAKAVDGDGAVSLLLADDLHEKAQLVVVLLDANERVVAHRPTRVGEES